MLLDLWVSDKLKGHNYKHVVQFMQMMINRLLVGHVRYGAPKKEQNYMTRMLMEYKAYKRTGNMEHLINIANYCWLESEAPENKNFHFDAKVESATRAKLGGAKA
jgi:hypothetical protein